MHKITNESIKISQNIFQLLTRIKYKLNNVWCSTYILSLPGIHFLYMDYLVVVQNHIQASSRQ